MYWYVFLFHVNFMGLGACYQLQQHHKGVGERIPLVPQGTRVELAGGRGIHATHGRHESWLEGIKKKNFTIAAYEPDGYEDCTFDKLQFSLFVLKYIIQQINEIIFSFH